MSRGGRPARHRLEARARGPAPTPSRSLVGGDPDQIRKFLLMLVDSALQRHGELVVTESDMTKRLPMLVLEGCDRGLKVRYATPAEAEKIAQMSGGVTMGMAVLPTPLTLAVLMRLSAAGIEAGN